MLRIGVVGAGRAAAAHMAAAAAIPSIDLVGLYDIANGPAEAAATRFNCRTFSTYDEMLSGVDAVVVATPNDTHSTFTCEALRNCKFVLCEKPMATTVDEAEKMVAQAALVELGGCVGFNYRYLPAVRVVMEVLRARILGDLVKVRLSLCRRSSSISNPESWRLDPAQRQTGGALGDLGCHLLDLMLQFVGQPVDLDSCQARIRWSNPRQSGVPAGDSFAFIEGRTSGSIEFSLFASKVAHSASLSIAIDGSAGSIVYNSSDQTCWLKTATGDRYDYDLLRLSSVPQAVNEVFGWTETFVMQMTEWCRKVRGESPPEFLATFEDGLLTQRLLGQVLSDAGLLYP